MGEICNLSYQQCSVMRVNKLSEVEESIIAYDEAEFEGRTRVPNWAIAAFDLEVFSSIGYPHRIRSARELWRYHDVMQDNRLEWNLSLIGKSMDLEADLVRSAASAISEFSLSHFGFASAGVDMLSRAVYQFSLVAETLKEQSRPWTILEVGPGCGYLGLLLGLCGHHYIALEASQAFRTYQSALFKHSFGAEYTDGLSGGTTRGRVSHLTWWDFCSENSTLPKLTLCTANHMLTEMNRMALEHLARKLASTQDQGFRILAEDSGFTKFNDEAHTWERLADAGFASHEVRPRVWIFTRAEEVRKVPKPAERRPLRVKVFELPLIGAFGSFVWRELRKFARLFQRTSKNPSSDFATRLEASQTMISLFRGFPSRRGADARFADGTW